MRILNFKDFMKKNSLENDSMNESQLRRVYNYPIYPRDSKIYSDKGFVNIDMNMKLLLKTLIYM